MNSESKHTLTRERDEAIGKRKVWHDFCVRVLRKHRADLADARAALRFYADGKHYHGDIIIDRGERARACLASAEGKAS